MASLICMIKLVPVELCYCWHQRDESDVDVCTAVCTSTHSVDGNTCVWVQGQHVTCFIGNLLVSTPTHVVYLMQSSDWGAVTTLYTTPILIIVLQLLRMCLNVFTH